MKKCPQCKFILTDQVAVCKYCGHVIAGADANDAQVSGANAGVSVETEAGTVTRPAAAVRRAGAESLQPGVGVPRHDTESVGGVWSLDDFFQPPRGRGENLAATIPVLGAHGSKVMRLVVVAVVVVVSVMSAFVVGGRLSGDGDVPVSRSNHWSAVGPPRLPLVVELPGVPVDSPLRRLELASQQAVDTTVANQTYIVGAAPLVDGALAFGADAYLRAVSDLVAKSRETNVVEGTFRDHTFGRAFAASLTSSKGAWGLVHVGIHDKLVFYVVAFVEGQSTDVRATFDRIVASIV